MGLKESFQSFRTQWRKRRAERPLTPDGFWVTSETFSIPEPMNPAPRSVSSDALNRGAALAAKLPSPHKRTQQK